MKNFKFLLAILAFFCFANMGISQSEKLQAKAAEKVEKLNAQIVAGNPDVALSEDQVAQITEIEIQKIKDIRALKKSGLSDEEMGAKKKEINKAAGKKIHQEVLTKEQRQAKKAGKAADKE